LRQCHLQRRAYAAAVAPAAAQWPQRITKEMGFVTEHQFTRVFI